MAKRGGTLSYLIDLARHNPEGARAWLRSIYAEHTRTENVARAVGVSLRTLKTALRIIGMSAATETRLAASEFRLPPLREVNAWLGVP